MTAVAGGDRRALAALYDLHAPVLLGICRRMLGDPAAAEDLLHDVFVEVWHHAADYAPSRGSVLVWLTVRTRSRALDRLGRQKRHTRVLERLGDETTEIGPAPAATLVDGARLRALLARLPPELIAVLDLAYFEGLSAAEIGARSGIPIGTVKSRLARAIALLREAIDLPHEDRR
ncbi:MAG TPA: sigma-70 family RNA polymerase sigma factor [Polyangia bacterium]|nr:sigma-70 family RNA polymerase sigma factor [Polyangia bacterium]